MNYKIFTKDAPHIKTKRNLQKTMLDVIIALLPVLAISIYFFKARAVLLISTCLISCLVFDVLFERLRGRDISASNLSSVVTGLLLALILPPSLPILAAVLGSAVAVFLGKQIFGGLGANIFNPALVGRAFLVATYPILMTTWIKPHTLVAVTEATPLGLMKFEGISTNLMNLFLGNISGSLGETSALALIIGGAYLLLRKCIDWRIPLSFIMSVIIFSSILNLIDAAKYPSVLFELFSGGLLIGAFFMATDPVTSPVTIKGRWVFGAGCGVVVMVIRRWGGLPEGVMYSILFMNALRPLIDKFSRPVCLGGSK
jgi:Na+-translocating ferredoxin:NAD+ oxidoreductase subunit D